MSLSSNFSSAIFFSAVNFYDFPPGSTAENNSAIDKSFALAGQDLDLLTWILGEKKTACERFVVVLPPAFSPVEFYTRAASALRKDYFSSLRMIWSKMYYNGEAV